jgi:hypothetical protein
MGRRALKINPNKKHSDIIQHTRGASEKKKKKKE